MGKRHQAMFGIFDGHSGSKASQFLWEALQSKLENNYIDLKADTIPTIKNSM